MTTVSHDVKWITIRDTLLKHGLDLSMVKPIQQAKIIAQAESDDLIGLEPRGDEWREFAEHLAEQHPTWAGEGFWRLKHATELIDNWHSGVFDDPSSNPVAEELAENRYAIVSWYDGSSNVYAAGDSIRSILETIMGLHFQSESPEYAEFYVDLDTGEHHQLRDKLTTVITLTLENEEYTV